MPKFIITERIPATLAWVYEVEADNEEDALQQVMNGDVETGDYVLEEVDYEKVEYDVDEEEAE